MGERGLGGRHGRCHLLNIWCATIGTLLVLSTRMSYTDCLGIRLVLSCTIISKPRRVYHANGGDGLWHANRRTSGQLSFEDSWILLLNNSRELVPITDCSDSK